MWLLRQTNHIKIPALTEENSHIYNFEPVYFRTVHRHA